MGISYPNPCQQMTGIFMKYKLEKIIDDLKKILTTNEKSPCPSCGVVSEIGRSLLIKGNGEIQIKVYHRICPHCLIEWETYF